MLGRTCRIRRADPKLAEHLAPREWFGLSPAVVKAVDNPLGAHGVATVLNDVNIAAENETSFLGEVLRLTGCRHHPPGWVGDSHVSELCHDSSDVVGTLAVGLDADQTSLN